MNQCSYFGILSFLISDELLDFELKNYEKGELVSPLLKDYFDWVNFYISRKKDIILYTVKFDPITKFSYVLVVFHIDKTKLEFEYIEEEFGLIEKIIREFIKQNFCEEVVEYVGNVHKEFSLIKITSDEKPSVEEMELYSPIEYSYLLKEANLGFNTYFIFSGEIENVIEIEAMAIVLNTFLNIYPIQLASLIGMIYICHFYKFWDTQIEELILKEDYISIERLFEKTAHKSLKSLIELRKILQKIRTYLDLYKKSGQVYSELAETLFVRIEGMIANVEREIDERFAKIQVEQTYFIIALTIIIIILTIILAIPLIISGFRYVLGVLTNFLL